MQNNELAALRQKAKLPAKEAGGQLVADFFKANEESIAAVLPEHVKPQRMIKLALGAIRNNPKLLECTTISLVGAVIQCAQLGLEPNTPLGQAYLIPFKNRRAKRTDVQVIFGYRGLIDLAKRSGQVESISAHVVYEYDQFEFSYGLEEKLVHVPAIDLEDRGRMVCAYAVAKLKGGGYQFEVMGANEIGNIKLNYSQSKGEYGPWKDHEPEMWRKSTVRRLFKYLPVSVEAITAAQMEEVSESGNSQHLETVFEGEYSIESEDFERLEDQEEAPEEAERPEGAPPFVVEIEGTWFPTGFTPEGEVDETWVDSTGTIFDPNLHSFSKKYQCPPVNREGVFLAKRTLK